MFLFSSLILHSLFFVPSVCSFLHWFQRPSGRDTNCLSLLLDIYLFLSLTTLSQFCLLFLHYFCHPFIVNAKQKVCLSEITFKGGAIECSVRPMKEGRKESTITPNWTLSLTQDEINLSSCPKFDCGFFLD